MHPALPQAPPLASSQINRCLWTVKQIAQRNPAFSEGGLRNLIFLAEARRTKKAIIRGNGLGEALVRIGRKLLIDEELFFKWIEQQQKRRVANNEVLQ